MLEGISQKAMDLNYAIESLKEELQAVNDYLQRAEMSENTELKEIMLHNAKEEMEHSSMIIEWIRRNNEEFGKEISEYLFSIKKITEVEEEITSTEEEVTFTNVEVVGEIDGIKDTESLNIGSLKD